MASEFSEKLIFSEDDILVGTTKIMNGNSLIESLFDKFGEKEEYATGSSVTPTS